MPDRSALVTTPAFTKITRYRGFTLTEIAVVLIIISLLMGYAITTGTAYLEVQANKQTQAKLRIVESALIGYVAVHGRLPCPANALSGTGTEHGSVLGCLDGQTNGVVPWVTLGLSKADGTDAWYNQITYRVGHHLWAAGGMDMTACDPAGTDSTPATPKLCATGCSSANPVSCTPPAAFLQSDKGLDIRDPVGNLQMSSAATPSTGAAFVLISHGKTGHGAFPSDSTNLIAYPGAGTAELQNVNGVAWSSGKFYVDADYNDTNGANHFDDILIRPSIMSVLLQAQRGPRAR